MRAEIDILFYLYDKFTSSGTQMCNVCPFGGPDEIPVFDGAMGTFIKRAEGATMLHALDAMPEPPISRQE